jgi:LPS-assembly lipoprotein
MKIIYSLFFIVSCFLLTGCGFHLRGHEPLPTELHTMYVKSDNPYGAFTKLLERTLHGIGVTLVQEPTQAPYTLQILSEDFSQQLTSQGASGQLSTYLLVYTVSYQLVNANGTIIKMPSNVTATRSYSAAANQISGDINIQNSLKDDMQLDAVVQVLTHLRSHSTVQLLTPTAAGTSHATAP